MTLFINSSPKLKSSNSDYFINLLNIDKKIINYIYKDDYSTIKKNILLSDTIIFIFPTYVDIIPSKLIDFIEKYNGNFKNKNIYLIVNCGFLESKHNDLSIKYMNNYINKKSGNFKGYISIGSGEVIGICKKNKLLKLLCINFFLKIKKFNKAINNKENIELSTNIKVFTKRLFCFICNKFWKKRIYNKKKSNR